MQVPCIESLDTTRSLEIPQKRLRLRPMLATPEAETAPPTRPGDVHLLGGTDAMDPQTIPSPSPALPSLSDLHQSPPSQQTKDMTATAGTTTAVNEHNRIPSKIVSDDSVPSPAVASVAEWTKMHEENALLKQQSKSWEEVCAHKDAQVREFKRLVEESQRNAAQEEAELNNELEELKRQIVHLEGLAKKTSSPGTADASSEPHATYVMKGVLEKLGVSQVVCQRLRKLNSELQDDAAASKAILAHTKSNLSGAQSTNSKLTDENKQKQTMIDNLEGETQRLREQLATTQTHLTTAKSQIDQLTPQLDNVQAERDALAAAQADLEKRVAEMEKSALSAADVAKQRTEWKTKFYTSQKETEQARGQLANVVKDYETLKQEHWISRNDASAREKLSTREIGDLREQIRREQIASADKDVQLRSLRDKLQQKVVAVEDQLKASQQQVTNLQQDLAAAIGAKDAAQTNANSIYSDMLNGIEGAIKNSREELSRSQADNQRLGNEVRALLETKTNLDSQLHQLRQSTADLENLLRTANAKVAELEQRPGGGDPRLPARILDLEAQLQTVINAHKTTNENHANELQASRNHISHLEMALTTADTVNQGLKKRLGELEQERTSTPSVNSQIEQLQREKTNAEDDADDSRKQMTHAVRLLEGLKRDNAKLEEEKAKLEQDVKSSSVQRDDYCEKLAQARNLIIIDADRIETLRTEIEELRNEKNVLNTKVQDLETTIENFRAAGRNLQEQVSGYARDLEPFEQLRQQIAEMESHLAQVNLMKERYAKFERRLGEVSGDRDRELRVARGRIMELEDLLKSTDARARSIQNDLDAVRIQFINRSEAHERDVADLDVVNQELAQERGVLQDELVRERQARTLDKETSQREKVELQKRLNLAVAQVQTSVGRDEIESLKAVYRQDVDNFKSKFEKEVHALQTDKVNLSAHIESLEARLREARRNSSISKPIKMPPDTQLIEENMKLHGELASLQLQWRELIVLKASCETQIEYYRKKLLQESDSRRSVEMQLQNMKAYSAQLACRITAAEDCEADMRKREADAQQNMAKIAALLTKSRKEIEELRDENQKCHELIQWHEEERQTTQEIASRSKTSIVIGNSSKTNSTDGQNRGSGSISNKRGKGPLAESMPIVIDDSPPQPQQQLQSGPTTELPPLELKRKLSERDVSGESNKKARRESSLVTEPTPITIKTPSLLNGTISLPPSVSQTQSSPSSRISALPLRSSSAQPQSASIATPQPSPQQQQSCLSVGKGRSAPPSAQPRSSPTQSHGGVNGNTDEAPSQPPSATSSRVLSPTDTSTSTNANVASATMVIDDDDAAEEKRPTVSRMSPKQVSSIDEPSSTSSASITTNGSPPDEQPTPLSVAASHSAAPHIADPSPVVMVATSGFKSTEPLFNGNLNNQLQSAVEKLGGIYHPGGSDDFVAGITHVIIGGNTKTFKTYCAAMLGKWLIFEYLWVFDSLKAGKWLPEGPYGVRMALAPPFRGKKYYIADSFKEENKDTASAKQAYRLNFATKLIQFGGGCFVESVKEADCVLKGRNDKTHYAASIEWNELLRQIGHPNWRRSQLPLAGVQPNP
ncbi:hypothetical protein SeMB42_g07029 [Synchytrium endobioticum]|uniref:BRCT domain-containing protein n=1 Tax=Synchytrium endobioticum TaxID=286115 RepID=A0A507CGZ9_9FUNG|nr:hypothetical protein SeMB42_g07029 [Synchytrium endobioticum]TPX45724.1 hypothetical protein SeLEV6574_g03710 [Synchytrium endobioticum]